MESPIKSLYQAIEAIEIRDDATELETIQAFSYIYKHNHHLHLQGWYGRTIRDLIEGGVMDRDGSILNPETLAS